MSVARLVMPFEIVSRDEWGAKPAKSVDMINKTVPYVIIHHSYSPPACNTSEECTAAMQSMQRFHQVERGWFDIGYQWVKFLLWNVLFMLFEINQIITKLNTTLFTDLLSVVMEKCMRVAVSMWLALMHQATMTRALAFAWLVIGKVLKTYSTWFTNREQIDFESEFSFSFKFWVYLIVPLSKM